MKDKKTPERPCGHRFNLGSQCPVCWAEIENARARRAKSPRRMPPLRHCDNGHIWRGFSEACPICAKRGRQDESFRDTRRRLNADS